MDFWKFWCRLCVLDWQVTYIDTLQLEDLGHWLVHSMDTTSGRLRKSQKQLVDAGHDVPFLTAQWQSWRAHKSKPLLCEGFYV